MLPAIEVENLSFLQSILPRKEGNEQNMNDIHVIKPLVGVPLSSSSYKLFHIIKHGIRE